jgi:peptidoglycan hydrolase-like protein with peptidoglycan-binding domain
VEDIKPEVKAEPVALAVEPITIPAVVVEAKPEPVKEPEVVVKKEAPAVAAAAEEPKPEGKKLAGAGVYVQVAALVHGSRVKNSRSVASVQSRLIELGFSEAGNDKRGTFGDSTLEALTAFHKDSKVKADNCIDKPVIVALFKGTAVEVLA